MLLSEIVTEDGVKLVEGMNVYELYNRGMGRFTVWGSYVQTIQQDGVVTYSRDELMSSFIPIVKGRAVGLWSSRATLESGLGRGA